METDVQRTAYPQVRLHIFMRVTLSGCNHSKLSAISLCTFRQDFQLPWADYQKPHSISGLWQPCSSVPHIWADGAHAVAYCIGRRPHGMRGHLDHPMMQFADVHVPDHQPQIQLPVVPTLAQDLLAASFAEIRDSKIIFENCRIAWSNIIAAFIRTNQLYLSNLLPSPVHPPPLLPPFTSSTTPTSSAPPTPHQINQPLRLEILRSTEHALQSEIEDAIQGLYVLNPL